MEGGEQGNLATRVHVQQSVSTGLGDDMATGYRQKAVWIAVEVRCSVGVEAAVRIECRLVRRDVVDIAQAAVWQELDQPAEPISNLAQERSIGRIGLQSDREVRSPEPGDPEDRQLIAWAHPQECDVVRPGLGHAVRAGE